MYTRQHLSVSVYSSTSASPPLADVKTPSSLTCLFLHLATGERCFPSSSEPKPCYYSHTAAMMCFFVLFLVQLRNERLHVVYCFWRFNKMQLVPLGYYWQQKASTTESFPPKMFPCLCMCICSVTYPGNQISEVFSWIVILFWSKLMVYKQEQIED